MSYTIFSLRIVYNSLVRMGSYQSQPMYGQHPSMFGQQQQAQGMLPMGGKKKQSAGVHHEGGVSHEGQQGGRRGGRKAGRRGGSRRGGKRGGTRKRGGKRGGTRKGGKK